MTPSPAPTYCDPSGFEVSEAFARGLDDCDPLASYGDRFHIPVAKDGSPCIYFAGNSLGLQPKSAREYLNGELDGWAERAVDAHFEGGRPWYPYHELFRESGARLVGALPGEVVMMNSLTVNLHLMMVSFYRPTATRRKILTDYPTFPSDMYALKSQIQHRGYDSKEDLVLLKPREGEHVLQARDIAEAIQANGEQLALVMLNGINFFTGQAYDLQTIAEQARRQGCVVGFDLAHAVGNIELRLHDWDVDFAIWCNYKYLNSGPGAVGGCFVHDRHGKNLDVPRFAGWWGNDPEQRFKMHLLPDFVPREGAEGWQISNPPILALAPVKASMDIFEEVGMPALRAKSVALTGYLHYLIDRQNGTERDASRFEVITPSDAAARGCQLSILAHDRPRELFDSLLTAGVVCDFRQPNVIRVAPVPLYNTFLEVWRFADILRRHARS